MINRTLIGLVVTCAFAVLLWWVLARTDAALQTANGLAGEYWYQLTLSEQAIGYYRSRAYRNRAGEREFDTELRFALAAEQPVTIRESYVFAANAPYPLIQASHQVTRAGVEQQVTVTHTDSGLMAQRSQRGTPATDSRRLVSAEAQTPQPLDWQYTLRDYLAFESWIRDAKPNRGATIALSSPNLDTLTMDRDLFELRNSSPLGYEVQKRSLLQDTVIQLDPNLVPIRFELAGVFTLTRSTRALALAAPTALQQSSYRLPLDRAIANPHALTRLTLRVHGAKLGEFPKMLVLTANPLVPPTATDHLGASLDHPVDHPRLQQELAGLQLTHLPEEQQVNRLLEHVHRVMTYDERIGSRSVLELLDQPSGDCTEYADLFTTLARAAGLRTSTVIGMAYTDKPAPALAFHAWNQVLVNGSWQAVDPTWGQRRVDATHWPLPTSERQAMLLLTGQIDAQLEVISTSYDKGASLPPT